MKLSSIPRDDGFYMPAEFSPVESVWLAWPERSDNWRQQALPAQQAFADVANNIGNHVKVVVVVSANQFQQAKQMLASDIELIAMDYNDAWMRDIGPTILVNGLGVRRGVSWQFNAWGGEYNGLYYDWANDDLVAEKVCNLLDIDYYRAPFVLEGGSIHTDGEGTLYTTEECLLSQGRNPFLTKEEIEFYLQQYLSIDKIIWLPNGLINDETDGHIDNIIHVIGPAKVILSWTDDVNDPQYIRSRQAEDVLLAERDAKNRVIEIIKLPLPGPLYYESGEVESIDISKGMSRCAGERLSASYANFLIVNNNIFFPLLDTKTDNQAISIIENTLPSYNVVGIPAREILLGGGNIHCITQHIPRL